MIPGDTVNLPACAFGAGVAHAAVLALVLPIMITLPAPGADTAPGPVAIQVEIRTAPPEAPMSEEVVTEAPVTEAPMSEVPMAEVPMAEGDAEDNGETMDLPPSPDPVEATGALPDMPELAALPEPVEAVVPDELPETDGAIRGPEPAADAEPRALANIEPDVPPAAVPFPLRKPHVTVEAKDEKEDEAKPAPKRRASVSAPAPRARAPAKSQPAYKGIFGGRRAITMPEYPSPGQPFGNRQ